MDFNLAPVVFFFCLHWTQANTGYFWLISDIELQSNQNPCNNIVKNRLSYQNNNNNCSNKGMFSWSFPLEHFVQSLKAINTPQTHFILWNGQITINSSTSSIATMEFMSFLLEREFGPLLEIYPVISGGAATDGHLASIKRLWSKWIPPESIDVFQTGGFYSIENKHKHLKLVLLNTKHFISPHCILQQQQQQQYSNQSESQALLSRDQLAWLDRMLANARVTRHKVYIFGYHAPQSFNTECRQKYLEIVLEHFSVVKGQFFASAQGQGKNTFRIVYKQDKPVGYYLLGSTTQITNTKKKSGGGQFDYSGVRLYKFNTHNAVLLDYAEYSKNGAETDWRVSFNFSLATNLSRITADTLHQLVTDNRLLQRYLDGRCNGNVSCFAEEHCKMKLSHVGVVASLEECKAAGVAAILGTGRGRPASCAAESGISISRQIFFVLIIANLISRPNLQCILLLFIYYAQEINSVN